LLLLKLAGIVGTVEKSMTVGC